MANCRAVITSLFATVLLVGQALAQTAPTSQPATAAAGDGLRVLLITMGPGAEPWEKFGHDAIAIIDADTGQGRCYNWGVFSFGEGFRGIVGFGWQFLQGRLLYSMQSDPAGPMTQAYIDVGRSVVLQELDLTSDQKLDLQRRLQAQDTEANRYYLYDYYEKNCSTMTRDALDQTVGGRIKLALQDVPTGTTFRWHDRRLTADELWLYTFLDYVLGHEVDRGLSAWQESFLPTRLAVHLRKVRVPNARGEMVPLVRWERQLSPGIYTERAVPPRYFVWGFLGAGVGVGAALLALGILSRRFRVAWWAFALLAIPVCLIIGIAGVLPTWSWFTNHLAAKWNENWFQVTPLPLLLIVAIPLIGRWPRFATRTAFLIVAMSLLGIVLKVLPAWRQPNGQIIALVLPIYLGLYLAMRARRTTPFRSREALTRGPHEVEAVPDAPRSAG